MIIWCNWMWFLSWNEEDELIWSYTSMCIEGKNWFDHILVCVLKGKIDFEFNAETWILKIFPNKTYPIDASNNNSIIKLIRSNLTLHEYWIDPFWFANSSPLNLPCYDSSQKKLCVGTISNQITKSFMKDYYMRWSNLVFLINGSFWFK